MLKYWCRTKEKCLKGTGLNYCQNAELQWIMVIEPSKEEIDALSKDFEINKKYFERYAKEIRAIKYSNTPLIFTLIDYYLDNDEIKKSRLLFAIFGNAIITVSHNGKGYFPKLFDDVCEKFEAEKGKHIEMLLYDFLDRDISENYDILTRIDDDIANLEVSALKYSEGKKIREIISLKRELNKMSRRIWSTAKIIFAIRKEVTPLRINTEGRMALDEIYENLIHQMDILGSQKESLIDALTIYETTVSNQLAIINNDLNTVMKRLTTLMLLLMVPSLIASIYGMNFKFIPELTSPYGFFEAIGVMLLVTILLYFYAKKKKWV